jgi:hypothetical protein
MKFYGEHEADYVKATFEIDSENDFSETHLAISALGSFALNEQDELTRRSISFLAIKLLKINSVNGESEKSSDKPKEATADLSPQEAETLLEALKHFRTIELDDIYNYGNMRNYRAVSTRVVENAMAEVMEEQIRAEFEFDQTQLILKPVFGFGADLTEK